MKSSRYNIILERENASYLFFNCFSGAFLEMDRKNYDDFLMITGGNFTVNNAGCELLDFIEQLKRTKIITDYDIDEFKLIKATHNMVRYDATKLSLEIAPSYDCNLNCDYCYFAHRCGEHMTRDVENVIIEFVKQNLEGKSMFRTSWIGGEPTMNPEAMYRLSEAFIKMSDAQGVSYSSLIHTNGYLLDRKMAKKLLECRINYAQITIDGPPEIHNKRRGLKNGNGSFDAIMRNVSEIADIINVTFRLNLDKTNANASFITEMLDLMEKYDIPKSIQFDIQPIQPFSSACSEFASSNGFSKKEFAEVLVKLLPLAYERGYNFSKKIITPQIGGCPSCWSNTYIFGVDGNIFRCLALLGDSDEIIGSLLHPTDQIKEKMSKWIAWDAFARKECRECAILPLCMGGDGCPFPDVANSKTVRSGVRCSPFKFKSKELLEIFYKYWRN